MTKEVMKQALKALNTPRPSDSYPPLWCTYENTINTAIKALEEALKQEQDEPVAMRYDFDGYGYKYIDSGSGSDWQTREKGAEPLYTKPQTKEWVGLTDEQIEEIWGNTPMMLNSRNNLTRIFFAKAIEAKSKERNT